MNKEIYIHIGYPRTGTTTLRECLFPIHSELIDISIDMMNYFFQGQNYDYIHNNNIIIASRENAFKRDIEIHKKNLLQILENKNDKNKYIYSEDILITSSMISINTPKPFVYSVEPNSIARKLKFLFLDTKIFNKIKIIITIRRQDELLKSFYAELYWLFKSIRETNTFDKFFKYALIENKDNFIADSLFYYDIIKNYENLFGKENIKIFVFEELKFEKEFFLKKLSAFMDIDCKETLDVIGNNKKNLRSSIDGEYILKINLIDEFLNFIRKFYKKKSIFNEFPIIYKFRKHIKNFTNFKTGIIKDLTQEQKKIIFELYSTSNKLLSDSYNLNLEKYGYFNSLFLNDYKTKLKYWKID